MHQLTIEKRDLPYEIDEEIKTLRTNLLLCGDDKRIVMITSCLGSEGKSSIAWELARSLSDLGRRVFLVDADLRRSVFNQRVVLGTIQQGLTHYLAGQSSLEDAMYNCEGTRITVMPAGTAPPNPSELLAGERMTRLLQESRKAFDYVLVDCAPLGMVVDASVVAPHCDGSLLLIESGVISYRFAQEVMSKLRNAHCPVLGVVLNKVDRTKSKYYGHYGKYGKYGKYGQNRYENYYKK